MYSEDQDVLEVMTYFANNSTFVLKSGNETDVPDDIGDLNPQDFGMNVFYTEVAVWDPTAPKNEKGFQSQGYWDLYYDSSMFDRS